MIIIAGILRHEKGGIEIVSELNVLQVISYRRHVPLPGGHPILEKGVVGHERGDVDGPHQVLLNFGVNIITDERQLTAHDGVSYGTTRNLIVEQIDDEEGKE